MLITGKNEGIRFGSSERRWQGIPGVACTKKGRLFVTFYSGGITEELGNYCVLVVSDDDGQSWTEPICVAYSGENARCYDPCLWMDPYHRLWFIWSEMPSGSVFCSLCENPDADTLHFSEPRVIAHGVMMNKPLVAGNGIWYFPVAVWNNGIKAGGFSFGDDEEKGSFVYATRDGGETLIRMGAADVPERTYDEHMVLELTDGRLAMYVRTKYGIGISFSNDGGQTWSEGRESGLKGPNSRFHIQRLPSGNILLINHDRYQGRDHLTAFLSQDDGSTWNGGLLLDERSNVSYPDAAVSADGAIYAVYDRERGAVYDKNTDYSDYAREILLAKFSEADILAGSLSDGTGFLKRTVSRLHHPQQKERQD